MGKRITPGIVVAFGNQKGGVGKTVMTSMISNYIHNVYGKDLSVVTVDSDDLQSSLFRLREREIEDMSENDRKKLYRLVQIDSEDLPEQIEVLQDEFDIIFIDLPGNLKQPGVITAYHLVDLLIIPSQASHFDIDSTIQFVNVYDDIVKARKQNGLNTGIFGVFSRVDAQNKDFKTLMANKENLPIKFLDNFVSESKVAFQRNVSTIHNYENSKRDDFSDVCNEIIETILKFANNER